MSRAVHHSPLAFTSEGRVILNLAMFDVPRTLEALVHVAARERGEVFIGIVLSPAQVRLVQEHLGHAQREVSAWIVGARQRGRRKRQKMRRSR